jgi:hypothetical protein
MGLLDWFRSGPPIDRREALIEFVETRAAFLIQKNIFDYTRARSGPFFSSIINEAEFKKAVEVSRWSSWPLALAALAEMIHGALYAKAPSHAALVAAISKVALEVFDKYPVPEALGPEKWSDAREDLRARLSQLETHPPKFVKDIFMPTAKQIFDALPIHEELRKTDFEMVQNQLRINLVSMHDEFVRRANIPALLTSLGFHS